MSWLKQAKVGDLLYLRDDRVLAKIKSPLAEIKEGEGTIVLWISSCNPFVDKLVDWSTAKSDLWGVRVDGTNIINRQVIFPWLVGDREKLATLDPLGTSLEYQQTINTSITEYDANEKLPAPNGHYGIWRDLKGSFNDSRWSSDKKMTYDEAVKQADYLNRIGDQYHYVAKPINVSICTECYGRVLCSVGSPEEHEAKHITALMSAAEAAVADFQVIDAPIPLSGHQSFTAIPGCDEYLYPPVFDLYITGYDIGDRIKVFKFLRDFKSLSLKETLDILRSISDQPYRLIESDIEHYIEEVVEKLLAIGCRVDVHESIRT